MAAKRPFLIGLTGSLGMGKSETARMFAALGVPVYDADAAVHALYDVGGAASARIAEAFPETVTNGRVDRAALSRRVFADAAAFAKLEAIVHPLVAAAQQAFLTTHKDADFVVLDIPLLFETGQHERMDAVVVASAPQDLQRARAMARPGMTAEKLDAILARQTPDAEKRAQADFVVETDRGTDHAFEQVKSIMGALKARDAKNA